MRSAIPIGLIGFFAFWIAGAAAQPAGPTLGEAISVEGPTGTLAGTLVVGEGADPPALLIIPGSGPTDRDGNSPLGIEAATYRLLAEALAPLGVTSARIDKRGMFASAGAAADANAVTLSDYAADVAAWARALADRLDTPCIWLAGHSEGGLVALATVARTSAPVCGLVLIAAPGRPMGDILRAQLSANPANAPLLDQAFAIIDRLEAGERAEMDRMHPALLGLFAPAVQDFLISLMAVDPADLLAGYDGPVLIIQGDQDVQVTPADAERLAAAQPDASLHILPGVNHVLKTVPAGDRAANLASYGDPDLPLAAGLAPLIADFVGGD